MNVRRHLVIFARFPQVGTGKRRLAKDIGAVEAVRFQRVRISILIHRHTRDRRWNTWVAATPDWSGSWPPHLPRVTQGRGNLGRRMGYVMTVMPPGPVVIIGTDIPGISSAAIQRAFACLGACDAVFGPARDGGYWLIGLKRTPRVRLPFADVRWSTEYALADTVRNLPGARIGFIDRLDDVDDAVSLRSQPAWGRLCPARWRQDSTDWSIEQHSEHP